MPEFALKELEELFPSKETFVEFLREAIVSKLPKEEWNPENVKEFIMGCRTIEHGIPMFRTRFAEKRFEIDGKPSVLAVCWGGREMPKTTSRVFVNVPEETLEELEKTTGDWKKLIEKYGTKEEIKLAFDSPLELRGIRIFGKLKK